MKLYVAVTDNAWFDFLASLPDIDKVNNISILEAAHIKPFSQNGSHQVNNGILLRSDMHRLFDKGYMTITPRLNIEVSRRIKEEFNNGEYYFTFHGKGVHLPSNREDYPSSKFLTWHNEHVFRA